MALLGQRRVLDARFSTLQNLLLQMVGVQTSLSLSLSLRGCVCVYVCVCARARTGLCVCRSVCLPVCLSACLSVFEICLSHTRHNDTRRGELELPKSWQLSRCLALDGAGSYVYFFVCVFLRRRIERAYCSRLSPLPGLHCTSVPCLGLSLPK